MAAQELQITIVSAKHLKNVNWRNGDLRPYATVWLMHDHRLTTKPDEFNSTKPIWNEHFLLPLPFPPSRAVLNLEIRHDKASLVGTLRVPLKYLPDPENYKMIRTFDIIRPSGRPHGKIRLKLAFPERALTSPVIPEEILMMGGWTDEDGKFHFTHPPPPDGVAPIHHKPLEYTSFGKPNPFVFKNAESLLKQLLNKDHNNINSQNFETLYMIGDNPEVDVNGAKKVVDTVEEAVEYILQREANC